MAFKPPDQEERWLSPSAATAACPPGYPVTCEGGEYKIVEGIAIDEFSQECINKTLKELTDEQDGVKHLL